MMCYLAPIHYKQAIIICIFLPEIEFGPRDEVKGGAGAGDDVGYGAGSEVEVEDGDGLGYGAGSEVEARAGAETKVEAGAGAEVEIEAGAGAEVKARAGAKTIKVLYCKCVTYYFHCELFIITHFPHSTF